MANDILIINKNNLKIFEPDSSNVVTGEYQNKVYQRINILFNLALEQKALAYCKKLINQDQKCILVCETQGFSIWSEVDSDLQLSKSNSTNLTLPTIETEEGSSIQAPVVSAANFYVTQATLLIIQILIDEIEDLMGNRNKETFKKEIIEIFKKCHLPQTESLAKIEVLLSTDPLSNNHLPIWKQEQVDQLFSWLSILCLKYFKNTVFIEQIIEILKELPIYEKPDFVNCCMQFVRFSRF